MNYSLGIDAGSTMTKGILMADSKIIAHSMVSSSARTIDSINQVYAMLVAQAPIKPYFTITGYGRHLAENADKQITEITCHAKGALYLCPSVKTVVDIGGQDSKVLKIDNDGNLVDFLMNDKCAAGTGRFLEVMSKNLSANISLLDTITHQVEPHPISSMCTVFAESEVISLLAKGIAPEVILSGILSSIVTRTANFAARIGIEETVFFTGGVSRSNEFRQRLANEIGKEVMTDKMAQYAGAIGAAVIGQKKRVKIMA